MRGSGWKPSAGGEVMKPILMDEGLGKRAAAAAVKRCYELARAGVLTPPMTCTISEVDDDDRVVFQFCLPDLEGNVQMGDACPIRLDRTVYLPLRFVIEDEKVIHSCVFEVPQSAIQ